ncbi:MAG: DUF6183 family protein [Acidimicrobiia bacterium]|nr:DUF6183 family protein [Acidimicrobiia bacterium]
MTTEDVSRSLLAAAAAGEADLADLQRHTEALADEGSWAELAVLRDAMRAAPLGRRSVRPLVAHVEHRLALDAPGPLAGAIVREAEPDDFAIGPLSEVAAARHTWAELAPHLGDGPVRSLVAYERVLRGEDLRRDRSIDTSVFDLPLAIADWEPTYPIATYEPWRGIFPTPAGTPQLTETALSEELAPLVGDLGATEALLELVRPWTTESNGMAEAVCVHGDVFDAVGALGFESASIGRIEASRALATMAWTAASGGAHGRRRGAAAGRFLAWWTTAALADLTDDWPVHGDEIGDAAAELAWFAWSTDELVSAWSFRLAVVDPASGVSWAISAADQRLD